MVRLLQQQVRPHLLRGMAVSKAAAALKEKAAAMIAMQVGAAAVAAGNSCSDGRGSRSVLSDKWAFNRNQCGLRPCLSGSGDVAVGCCHPVLHAADIASWMLDCYLCCLNVLALDGACSLLW